MALWVASPSGVCAWGEGAGGTRNNGGGSGMVLGGDGGARQGQSLGTSQLVGGGGTPGTGCSLSLERFATSVTKRSVLEIKGPSDSACRNRA